MASNTVNLDAIKARLAAATPGPWGLQGAQNDYELRGPGPRVNGWNMGPLVMEVSRWNKHPSPADVALIEHAPADLTALIAEVERLRAELGRATSEAFDLGVKSGEGRERAATVAWLRSESFIMEYRRKRNLGRHMADVTADFIERGEHRREEER